MATIEDTPLWVDGTLTAGNIKAGRIYVAQPAAGKQSVEVTGLDLTGSGDLYVQVTGHSDLPAGRTNDSGLRNVSSLVTPGTTNRFTVYVNRSDTNGTWVFYFVTRNP